MRGLVELPDQPLRHSRRRALAALAALVAMPRAALAAHAPFGPVNPPLAAPAFPLSRDDGAQLNLPRCLRGKLTAVQLIFTRCTATCPIQGALFASVARRLRRPHTQLLSLSVDPAHDRPPVLDGWRTRFGAPAHWRAAAPAPDDVEALFTFFRGRAAGVDRHSAAVYMFDRDARLVFRSAELPSVEHVVELFTRLG